MLTLLLAAFRTVWSNSRTGKAGRSSRVGADQNVRRAALTGKSRGGRMCMEPPTLPDKRMARSSIDGARFCVLVWSACLKEAGPFPGRGGPSQPKKEKKNTETP